ncbi:MAG: alcohol dehydrogenase catalytic domain-containing protein [Actinomycetota bacterium]
MTIEGTGAVVEAQGGAVRIEPILVEDPGPGEVRVRVLANGICHSDHWAIENGNWGSPFPMLLGHEGAGTIDAVGPGVEGLTPGQAVVLAWAVPCGTCRTCRRAKPRRCAHEWEQPPRVRVARTGEALVGTLSLGSLATHTVVHAAQAVPVPPGLDLTRMCLLGCGVSTGVGAAVNTAAVDDGETVVVIGLGGIGLAALQGARISGASRVIAVDLVAAKLEVAGRLGATDVVDASSTDPVTAVRKLTEGEGVDVAFEATGNASVVGEAVAMLARSGRTVAIGVPSPGSTVSLAWGEGPDGAAYPNKATLLITDGGDPIPAEDFPVWLEWFRDGRLDLDTMVTRTVGFTEGELEEAFRAMLAGEVIRTVVRIE